MSIRSKQTIQTWLILTLIYAVFLVVWGYSYGHANSIQLIPVAHYMQDHSLYPHDFFVQNAIKDLPNERSFFMYLLYPLGNFLEWGVFIYHYLFTMLLFFGLFNSANLILKNRTWSFAVLLILFVPLFYHTLGLNELYGSEFTSTLASDALNAWAIYSLLLNRKLPAFLFCIAATFMHPLAGLQVFLLVAGTWFFQALANKTLGTYFKKTGPFLLLYFATAGIFLFLLSRRFNSGSISEADFFQIFYVFRNAHHYMPFEFPLFDKMLLGPLFLLTPLFFFKANKQVFIFTLLIIGGCIFYTWGAEVLRNGSITTAQWFKTTTWMEFFAVTGVLYWLKKWISPALQRADAVFISVTIAGCIAWIFFAFPGPKIMLQDLPHEFPFYTQMTPEIDISEQAKKVTPIDAVFIQPCSFDQLKHYGERSSYVDYKALTHSKGFIAEWAKRFQQVYQIDPLHSEVISFNAMHQADGNFKNLTVEQLEKLKQECGITHIIMYNETQLPLKAVASNSRYTIYEL